MAFTLHGRAGLAQLTEFLYKFYSAGHLHQIRQLDIKPVENSRELDLNMTVEAMSLVGADRKNTLSTESGRGLKLATLSDYRDPIVKRNLFAAYAPARGPSDRAIDASQYAFITGFTEVDGVRQVWIKDRIADKTWRLNVGGEFQIGGVQGTVETIGPSHEVVVDFDGQRRRLHDGENLRGGMTMEPSTQTP